MTEPLMPAELEVRREIATKCGCMHCRIELRHIATIDALLLGIDNELDHQRKHLVLRYLRVGDDVQSDV